MLENVNFEFDKFDVLPNAEDILNALLTNLENNQSVIVRVNDRGPFAGNRILDLSYAAAKEIGMISKGVVKVRIKILKWGT